ncbi:carbonic anhydrase [Arcanobacterium wilhelmae]|uniref:carbonic anhydrase n=1 Tax=Arcanobacterium wilhelmae TaxID=1803177 RepID=A0ABT9NAC6_9ACTO|nr:carbonic anhydrase [Arcanobacterium wilhelmae]MDP9800664.1 carbonic anhydrase [Arcanobacterium wilhelmae]WFN90067.1 carbonic anhydrase [Arcanobacterium wilhelmae]
MNAPELTRLLEGNARFAANTPDQPPENLLPQLVAGQHPFAAVFACADSRVAPEIIFNQPLGAIFTVRTAGHVIDDAVIASLEYAVDTLGVGLVAVVAHENCGAVKAALAAPASGMLAQAIAPVVTDANRTGADVERAHARETARLLATRLNAPVRALRYSLSTGKTEVL